MKKRTTETNKPVDNTRRKFLLNTAPAAGAVIAAAAAETKIFAGSSAEIPSIRIPKEIPASLSEAPKPGTFEGQGMTGAQVFAKLCKAEELAAMFCCPGNYTVINAIAALASRAEIHEPAIIEPAIEPLTSSASSTGLLHGSTFWNVA